MKMGRGGTPTVISSGYAAYEALDKTEGRGGERKIGIYTTLNEAVDASRCQGVQGEDGSVRLIEWIRWPSGLVEERLETVREFGSVPGQRNRVRFVGRWADACPMCGYLKDTPNHELGCAAGR